MLIEALGLKEVRVLGIRVMYEGCAGLGGGVDCWKGESGE